MPIATIPTRPAPGRGARLVIQCAVAAIVALGTASPALAVSTADLVQLAKAGLSDDVLIALVQADGTAFNLDAPKILDLRRQGLSERVIVAMLKNGHGAEAGGQAPAAPAASAASAPTAEDPPSLVIIGQQPPPPPVVEQQPVLVVPWMPVYGRPGHGHQAPRPTVGYRGFGRFINDGWVDRTASGTTAHR